MQHKKSFFDKKIRGHQKLIKTGKYKIKNKKKSLKGNNFKRLFIWKSRTKNNYSLWFGLTLAFAVILGVFYLFFLTPYFRIVSIELREGGAVSQNLVLNRVAAQFRGKNIILLGKRKIARRFLMVNPRIQNLEIDKQLPNKLVIDLSEIPLKANILVRKGRVESKFIVNEIGVVVKADEVSDKLPTIIHEAKEVPVVNQQYLEPDLLNKLVDAKEIFESTFNLPINEVNYLEVAREVHLKAERGFKIWIDLGKDVEDQINKLKAAIPKLNIYEQEFEYIDLRIAGATGDRIIYKRVNN